MLVQGLLGSLSSMECVVVLPKVSSERPFERSYIILDLVCIAGGGEEGNCIGRLAERIGQD